MPKYRVTYTMPICLTFLVDAESEDEAIDKTENLPKHESEIYVQDGQDWEIAYVEELK